MFASSALLTSVSSMRSLPCTEALHRPSVFLVCVCIMAAVSFSGAWAAVHAAHSDGALPGTHSGMACTLPGHGLRLLPGALAAVHVSLARLHPGQSQSSPCEKFWTVLTIVCRKWQEEYAGPLFCEPQCSFVRYIVARFRLESVVLSEAGLAVAPPPQLCRRS